MGVNISEIAAIIIKMSELLINEDGFLNLNLILISPYIDKMITRISRNVIPPNPQKLGSFTN